MVCSYRILMLAAPLLGSFLSTIVTASPIDYSENLGLNDNILNVEKRAAVTCYHGADPENICPAIADGPGWCECNNDGKTYAILSGQNPCGWTTLPPTISFNCAAILPPAPSSTIGNGKKAVPKNERIKRSEFNGIELGGFR